MSMKKNKALISRMYELQNQQKLEEYFDLLAPVYTEQWTDRTLSREESKQATIAFFKSFPDGSATIEEMVVEDDKVALRVTWRGTHLGEFRGIPPTGKEVTMTNTAIFIIAGGKCVKCMATVDSLHFMQQLGIIPAV